MPDGTYELVIDLEFFAFSRAGPGIDTLPLAAIVDPAALRSVKKFATAGYVDSAETEAYVTV